MRKVLAFLTFIASTAGAQTQIGTYTPPTVPAFAGATGPFSTNAVGQGFFAPVGALSLTSLTYGLASIGNGSGADQAPSRFLRSTISCRRGPHCLPKGTPIGRYPGFRP